ncbi:unnamed protein product, partial [Prorocentrum cordatum]
MTRLGCSFNLGVGEPLRVVVADGSWSRTMYCPAAGPALHIAYEPAKESKRPEPGSRIDVWEVEYPDGPPQDLIFGGGKANTNVQNQYNVRVLKVMPGGPSEAAGVRPNDEVSLLIAPDKTARFRSIARTEENLRTMQDPNRDIPLKLPRGGSVVFRAKSGLQVGDRVPDFSLPSVRGFNISLRNIIESGDPVVIWFHPGERFYGGDREELKYFAKAGPIFKDLGVNVVGITTDAAPNQLRSGQQYATQFPLLTDETGEVADLFGLGPQRGPAAPPARQRR